MTEDEYRAREERNEVPKLYRELLELKCGELGALSGAWAGFRLVNGALFPPDYARGFPPERILAIHWLQESNAALRAELRQAGRTVPDWLDQVAPCGRGLASTDLGGRGKADKAGSARERRLRSVTGRSNASVSTGGKAVAKGGRKPVILPLQTQRVSAAADYVLRPLQTGPPVEIFRPPVPLDNTAPAVGRVTSPALSESSGTHTVSRRPDTETSEPHQCRESFAHPCAGLRAFLAVGDRLKPTLQTAELISTKKAELLKLQLQITAKPEFQTHLSRQATEEQPAPSPAKLPGEAPSIRASASLHRGDSTHKGESATPIAVGAGFGSTPNRDGTVAPAQLASAAHRFESVSLRQGLLTSLSAAPTLPKESGEGKSTGYTLCAFEPRLSPARGDRP